MITSLPDLFQMKSQDLRGGPAGLRGPQMITIPDEKSRSERRASWAERSPDDHKSPRSIPDEKSRSERRASWADRSPRDSSNPPTTFLDIYNKLDRQMNRKLDVEVISKKIEIFATTKT